MRKITFIVHLVYICGLSLLLGCASVSKKKLKKDLGRIAAAPNCEAACEMLKEYIKSQVKK